MGVPIALGGLLFAFGLSGLFLLLYALLGILLLVLELLLFLFLFLLHGSHLASSHSMTLKPRNIRLLKEVTGLAKIVKQKWMNSVRQQQLIRTMELTALDAAGCFGVVRLLLQKQVLWAAVLAAVLGIVSASMIHSIRITKAGADGEQRTLALLQRLPRSYTVLPDCILRYREHQSQADYIIVGPSAILILECKNISGVIRGDVEGQDWSQVKYHDGAISERKHLYNPLKQVEGHARTLRNILRAADLQAPVLTAVYFSNPNAIVSIHGSTGKLLSAKDEQPVYRRIDALLCSIKGDIPQRDIVQCIRRSHRS